MKKIVLLAFVCSVFLFSNAQTPYQRVSSILYTKCQNSTCHSATSAEALKFDDSTQIWNSIYNKNPSNTNAQSRFDKIIKPGHPYSSFLLRKIAGATFDTDLTVETADSALMTDINGTQLTTKEIEFVRQWIMCGAKKTYSGSDVTPDWQVVSDYYDNPINPFLPKPAKPAPGTGIQLRMGPLLIGTTTNEAEREFLLQQEVNFPILPQVNKIDGFMNQQSHHFLLFRFQDSASSVARPYEMERVSLTGGVTSFDGEKVLTAAWQDDAEFQLPTGTALFWPQKTYLDGNFHVKNYNAVGVLPCDFYYNVYYQPRNVQTIEMKAALVNNALLVLPQGVQTRDYDDPFNSNSVLETRYLWNITSHAHKYGTDYDIYIRDSNGQVANKIYEGFNDYALDYDRGYYDWEHPSIEYWPDFMPVTFGRQNGHNSGLVARTTWDVQQALVTFGFTTNDEMQLFYYMYTSELPGEPNAVKDISAGNFSFNVYPNPMNNSGQLVYTLNTDAKVKASITDITGKEVATLTEENQVKGTHTVSIGAENNLAKGIYFANVSVDGTVHSKKFIVTE